MRASKTALLLVSAALACRAEGARERDASPRPSAAADAVADASHGPVDDARSCPPAPVHLQPPPATDGVGGAAVADADGKGRHVVARWYDARIFKEPDLDALVIGYARRGARLRVKGGASGTGCPADMWYELAAGGYACAAKDFREDGTEIPDPVEPDLDGALPFGYAKVIHEGAPRLQRLPTADELAALDAARSGDGALPSVVATKMDGAYFVTLTASVEHEGRKFFRTDDGQYVLADDVEQVDPPRARGKALDGASDLPLAFVRADQTVVYCRCGDEVVPCGEADAHARFEVKTRASFDGRAWISTDDDRWLRADAVRVAEVVDRPDDIGDGDRWMHVDLSRQTLVAYEGERAVYATIVSTGKGPEHATPTGLFRIDRKHLTTTMTGPDEVKGTYTVAEVPWTMFYDGAFALHGAYWHDAFGAVRSHGCTNIPPADARWLFAWSGPLASGWHAAANLAGPWVYITD
jgi:hypothetical protein